MRLSKIIVALLFCTLINSPLHAASEDSKRDARRAAWAAIGIEDYQPPLVRELSATTIAEYPAIEAGQGAAADEKYFYAIVNYVIGKYRRDNGELVSRWVGTRGGPIRHLNSCYVEGAKLFCANSNHPQLPMASSIEIFDTKTMTHLESKSFGVMDEGSLVWFDHYKDGWIAGFAHYDDETGLPFKDHSYASVVTYDKEWRRTGGYALPKTILDRMAPQAASGGAIGDDGRLYLLGHDRTEMYVMEFPKMGPVLDHVATITVPTEGQAFAFDHKNPRQVWGISRPRRSVVHFELPVLE
ncbi:hypothetical protein ABFZ85_10310 [Hyphococcus formosus]|uniref:hypothetical protein n=1 Tax=Hyphococcus formosus TaxID=3143534 RepID=UPI00398B1F12